MGTMTKRNACRGELILVLVILAALAEFQSGFAEERKWIGAPIEEIRQAAEEGDVSAQYELGSNYDWGWGVAKDHQEAVKWYRLAAEQGNVEAQRSLGFKYALGQGVWEDDREAVKWWRKAAEQGDADAQDLLANMYYHSDGVPQDYREAVKWSRLAAEQGHAEAQQRLGEIYRLGKGVPENYRESRKWYRLAAEQGMAGSQFRLGVELARECLHEMQDADRQFREEAIESLIRSVRTGRIPNLPSRKRCDLVEAYAWLLVAGAQGVELPDAVREMSQILMTTREVEQAQKLAAKIFNRIEASKSEHPPFR